MEKKHEINSMDSQAYWKIHKTIRKKIREGKEKWIYRKCNEIGSSYTRK